MRLFETACVSLLGSMAALSAAAQSVNLEELEARLKREKATEAEQQAEANRKSRAAAAMGTLVVLTDTNCILRINAETKGNLLANQSQTVKVSPGEQLIECDDGGGRRVETVETVPSSQQKVVRLVLPPPPRFMRVDDGVRDNEQGLVWASSDNGISVDWHGARNYCANKGVVWSLPTSAQLQQLHGKATSLFLLTEPWFWSAEMDGSASAFYVSLNDGRRYSASVSNTYAKRALCVRRNH